MFRPKSFSVLKDYTSAQFLKDLNAGILVGIVALPLAIAFAIASGVSPEKGLITAVIAGFLISALGGSRVQIGGPTGAFIIIVYGIVQEHGVAGLTTACLMAGVILIILGLARFGSVIKFIPHPVVVGFTSGIAVVIFSSQIKEFLGLSMEKVPTEFFERWEALGRNFVSLDPATTGVALGSLLIIAVWPRVTHRIPGPLVALAAATAAVQIFGLDVETIGSRFGAISSTIPAPELPALNFSTIQALIGPAFTIAILAAVESLLSAVVADGMIGGKHRSNTELIAQGVANIVSPLFGGIPATGAIARTATNVRNGGRTPVAGMVHALVLLLIMLFLGQWAVFIPLSALAAILVVVAYNMSEWRSFRALLRYPLSDVLVLLLTFFLTVIFDLTIAIEVGIVLSVFLFMRRMAMVTNVDLLTGPLDDSTENDISPELEHLPPNVEVYEINGPLFFGAAHKFDEAMRVVEKAPIVRILRMRNVPAIDATGMNALEAAHRKLTARGGRFLITEVREQPLAAMRKAGFDRMIGSENIFGSLDQALAHAERTVGESTRTSD